MAYTRQPNSVIAGRALTQNPPPTTIDPAGVLPVVVDADIATYNSLGVVQIGSGLSITPDGILSAENDRNDIINVTLTSVNYSAMLNDFYIGVTSKGVTVTLPLGFVGKVFIVKNQTNGNINVIGSLGETIDGSASKTLGSDDSLTVVFAGARWNII